jgi:hypothetical protein
MSRRFSDEPINLIHRIPSPEQLSAARPIKRSFSETLVETRAAIVRAVVELVAQVTRTGGKAETMTVARTVSQDGLDEGRKKPVVGVRDCLDEEVNQAYVVQPQAQTMVTTFGEREVSPSQPASTSTVVQPEEMAELRAYLLSQQQDIARLSMQIQELKSMVVSQQQVLVFLGKELEVAQTHPPATTAVASAPGKRNRIAHEKSMTKDKSSSRKNTHTPSLNL